MKAFGTAATIFVILIVFLLVPPLLHWEDIPGQLGGEEVSLDESGNRCWYFPVDDQLICFEEFATWYGKDAVPLYVVDAKGYTPIERSRKY
jgi:hypothetical protein